jgi:hypothetical protein
VTGAPGGRGCILVYLIADVLVINVNTAGSGSGGTIFDVRHVMLK